MSTQNVLQPLNCNVESPQRKRPRLEDHHSSCKYTSTQSWSFSFQERPEEMFCEMGVQMLDYEKDEDDETCSKYTEPDLMENETNPDLIDSSENKPPSSRTSNGSDQETKGSVHSESSSRCSYHSKSTNSVEQYAKDWSNYSTTKQSKEFGENGNLDYFEILPDEVVLAVFRWLPKMMLARSATVCQRWNRLSQDESLWCRMDVSNRFLEPGALGSVLSRQCLALRLAQAEISSPGILPNVKAYYPEFHSRLLYLDLSMTLISIPCLNSLLSKCSRLRKVSLEAGTVNDEICQHLSRNRDLEVLNLCMTEGLGIVGMTHILKNCTKLRELNMGWTYLELQVIKSICKLFPDTLHRLNISGCRKTIKDDCVADIVKSCPNLREFDLSDCTILTEKSIVFIKLLNELNFLSLSRCYMIPYTCLLTLKSLPSLIYLDVHGGHISSQEVTTIQSSTKVQVNKFTFSSIARPTVGNRRSSIWGLRVRDFP